MLTTGCVAPGAGQLRHPHTNKRMLSDTSSVPRTCHQETRENRRPDAAVLVEGVYQLVGEPSSVPPTLTEGLRANHGWGPDSTLPAVLQTMFSWNTATPPLFSTLSVAASPWNAGEGRCDSPPYSQPSLPALVWTCIRKAVLWEEKERGAFSLETRPLL